MMMLLMDAVVVVVAAFCVRHSVLFVSPLFFTFGFSHPFHSPEFLSVGIDMDLFLLVLYTTLYIRYVIVVVASTQPSLQQLHQVQK
jgi:hypothetical protein